MDTMKRITDKALTRAVSAFLQSAALTAVFLLSGSCTKHPDDGFLPGGGREIAISTRLDAAPEVQSDAPADGTKSPVADGSADSRAVLSDMHFLLKNGATVQTDFSGVTALTASRDAAGKITFGTVPTYDKSDLNAWFTAYWPATPAGGAAVTAGTKVVWTIAGDQDILLSTLDPSASYDAGKYTAPVSTGMTLQHVLAQLQVVCTANSSMDQAIVRAVWGKITKIEILTSPASVTYTYSTNALTYGGAGAVSLWKPDYTGKFEGQALELVKSSTTVIAAGMYPPSTGELKLKVYSERVTSGQEVSVQLKSGGTNKNFERGLTHKITLSFDALPQQITATASIAPWAVAADAEADKPDGIDPDLPF